MPELSAERWRVISLHLDRGLELGGDERDAWLQSLRAGDPTLAADLEALLGERDALIREGFLEGDAPALPVQTSLAGHRVGAYELVSQIGQGGMGSVWLARRCDGRFEGVAAVKLMNAGLIGRAGEARFRREGNILARLKHPRIAHLIDAGVSPIGPPYLVLEHVEGERIDRYCDDKGLGIGVRVGLFLDVLAAVAFAHANLIVHRDLKPSNVLVTNDGQVKLLDFGIAKLLDVDADSGQTTALTREGGVLLTPEHAAPEQVTGGPVTTATDVYALGVLLYLVLSGQHPAADATHSAADLLRAIVDTEPERVSSAVAESRTATPAELVATAARRASTPAKLRRLLRGDLDTIVAKALKKNPVERYASVTALADDLRHYLNHEPISARPDTPAYRAARFVRRNRVPVALAAIAATALAAGLVGTATQARRAARQAAVAEAQRSRADREARAASEQRDFALRQLSRAEAINDLNSFLLSDAAPSGKPFTVGKLLADAERAVERQRDSDENRVELMIAIGRQYQIDDEDDKARRLLARAHELARTLPDSATRAKAGCALASAVARAGETERAETLLREALGELPNEPQFELTRIFCLTRGSEVARHRGDGPGAIERVQLAQRILKGSPAASAVLRLRVSMDLAESYRMSGRNREAAAGFKEAFAHLVALGRDDTETAGTLLNNWGLALRSLGQPLEAEALFRQAVRISSADPAGQGVSPMLLNNLGWVLLHLHRLSEAAQCGERAYATARRAGNKVVHYQSLLLRANVYREAGDLVRASSMLSELEPMLKRMLPAGHLTFAAFASEQARLARARGDLDAAAVAADRAVAITEASTQGRDFLPVALARRSELELQLGRVDAAGADAARALQLELAAAETGAFSSRLGRAYLALGRTLHARGAHAEARTASTSALQHLEPSLGPDHPDTQEARRRAGTRTRDR